MYTYFDIREFENMFILATLKETCIQTYLNEDIFIMKIGYISFIYI